MKDPAEPGTVSGIGGKQKEIIQILVLLLQDAQSTEAGKQHRKFASWRSNHRVKRDDMSLFS